MTTRFIDKADWGSFCAGLSKALKDSRAEIDVASLERGDQTEKEWALWRGITYHPTDDTIDIALEEVDHIVNRPTELVADMDDVNISALRITDAEGIRHMVRLKGLLFLPAPQ